MRTRKRNLKAKLCRRAGRRTADKQGHSSSAEGWPFCRPIRSLTCHALELLRVAQVDWNRCATIGARCLPVILRPPSRFAGLWVRDDVRLLVEACDRLAFPTRRVAEKLAGGAARHERNHRNPPRKWIRPRGAGESCASSGAHPLGARNRWLRSCLASPPANLFQPSGLPPDSPATYTSRHWQGQRTEA